MKEVFKEEKIQMYLKNDTTEEKKNNRVDIEIEQQKLIMHPI